MPIKCYRTLKKDNFTMTMASKVSKMEVLQEVQDLEVYLICLVEEERNSQDLEKENQN